MSTPELYWISGSPPAWRVMLALTLKGVPFRSRRLDHGKGENKTPAYLALNPKGQVPTLVHDGLVVRESIAILAYLDRAWVNRPIFGATPAEAAAIWQDVMLFEGDLRPAVTTIAQSLLGNRSKERAEALAAAVGTLDQHYTALSTRLTDAPYLGGSEPMAADIWLYPAMGWIGRGIERTRDAVPPALAKWRVAHPALAAWHDRLAALPGVDATYPPHWRD